MLRFNDYPTMGAAIRRINPETRRLSNRDLYSQLVGGMAMTGSQMVLLDHSLGVMGANGSDDLTSLQLLTEVRWLSQKQPFYNLWPRIIPALTRVDLSKLTAEMCRKGLPDDVMAVRLPVEKNPLVYGRATIKSFLMGRVNYPDKAVGIMTCVDIGEMSEEGDWPVITIIHLPFRDGKSIEETLASKTWSPELDRGIAITEEMYCDLVRLVCTLLLLDQESDLFDRVVLNADAPKFESTNDPKYVSRAEQRGVHGWNIGRGIEMSPHIRLPHVGLRWCGPGGTIPRIVPIRGSIVHRDVVERLPTGLQAEEEQT